MGTLDTPPRLRSALGGRSDKPLLPHLPVQDRASPLKACAPDHRVIAQTLRPQPRVLKGGVSKPVLAGPAAPTVGHDAVSLGQIVLDSAFAGGTYLAFTDGAFRYFKHTHWLSLTEAELGGAILAHLPSGANRGGRHARTMIREVIDLLKMHRATGPDRTRLDEPLPIINVKNGELWIAPNGSVERRPHNPASGLRYCLDVAYDPTAACPLYDRALSEIFSVATDPAALADFWHEFTAYVLQPARPDARIFVGWGKGNDGKSALAKLLVRLLGPDRVAAMPVGKLACNPFMVGHLADKALFLDDDVAVGTVLPDGLLKTISEAKVVTGEPKHRDAFEFHVRALPLLLCNEAPHLLDTSHGSRRRYTVIPFDRRFTDAEADRTLFDRIWAEERSGVLNRALEGLQRVARRGWKFDPPQTVIKATDAWWSEATGVLPGPVSRRSPMKTKREPTAAVPVQVVRPERCPDRHVADIHTANPDLNLSVSVQLSEAGKGCKVLVQAGATEVAVSVTGAFAGDLPQDPRPLKVR